LKVAAKNRPTYAFIWPRPTIHQFLESQCAKNVTLKEKTAVSGNRMTALRLPVSGLFQETRAAPYAEAFANVVDLQTHCATTNGIVGRWRSDNEGRRQ